MREIYTRMDLTELTIDLSELTIDLADDLQDILVSEDCIDHTTLRYVQQLRAGELGYVQCLDELINYLKSLEC